MVGSLAEQSVPVLRLHLVSRHLPAVPGQEELALQTGLAPHHVRPADTAARVSTHQVYVVLLARSEHILTTQSPQTKEDFMIQ